MGAIGKFQAVHDFRHRKLTVDQKLPGFFHGEGYAVIKKALPGKAFDDPSQIAAIIVEQLCDLAGADSAVMLLEHLVDAGKEHGLRTALGGDVGHIIIACITQDIDQLKEKIL